VTTIRIVLADDHSVLRPVAIPAMRSEFPETQIVVLTTQPEPAFARQVFVAGAIGYVLKQAVDGELVGRCGWVQEALPSRSQGRAGD
jgi:DNA-binding NarL/FixJ family response regulator